MAAAQGLLTFSFLGAALALPRAAAGRRAALPFIAPAARASAASATRQAARNASNGAAGREAGADEEKRGD